MLSYVSVRDGLLSKIREAGFDIAMQKEVSITKEQAEDFYKEHRYVSPLLDASTLLYFLLFNHILKLQAMGWL